MAHVTVDEPFPISLIMGRYRIFDVNVIAHIRREHHILGVLTGNIPQASQQTIFHGLPLLLMPEEARFLVANGHAYIVDDVKAHQNVIDGNADNQKAYLELLEGHGLVAAQNIKNAIELRKAAALAKHKKKGKNRSSASRETSEDVPEDLLFGESSSKRTQVPKLSEDPLIANPITPTVSYPLVESRKAELQGFMPEWTNTYALFEHLLSKGYFMAPGLRFGCQFMAYPGDPLRFHSHFLAVSKEWNQPIDLLDLVGGGRLGTGVKKGYLIGGVEEDADSNRSVKDGPVRTFCFEWAAM